MQQKTYGSAPQQPQKKEPTMLGEYYIHDEYTYEQGDSKVSKMSAVYDQKPYLMRDRGCLCCCLSLITASMRSLFRS